MPGDDDLPVLSFPSAAAFEAWLEAEHERAAGLFLKIAKKSAGVPSVTAAEAVEVALCFGWIDGRANRVDDDWFTVRYTPRRARSVWSQKNVGTVGRLVAEGRMRPAGQAAVEAAQADGRWERAYAGPATITVPDDLAAALAAEPAAADFFAGLGKGDRYAVLWRVETASNPQTRAKRIAALVQMLAEGRPPGQPSATRRAPT
ncbi:YdeI/OmpD-associated family protein [Modestobacter sp. NPDC049651]|uniref:YdeI/OmpD-associated family protein n=1 Tax=unclassified Modestobacter TaxID=2643866 RepID=UPI00340154E0